MAKAKKQRKNVASAATMQRRMANAKRTIDGLSDADLNAAVAERIFNSLDAPADAYSSSMRLACAVAAVVSDSDDVSLVELQWFPVHGHHRASCSIFVGRYQKRVGIGTCDGQMSDERTMATAICRAALAWALAWKAVAQPGKG